MIQLIQTYLPNVYKLGWSGQYGWGTAIYLTLYMTVISFIIGGFFRFGDRAFVSLDPSRWCHRK